MYKTAKMIHADRFCKPEFVDQMQIYNVVPLFGT